MNHAVADRQPGTNLDHAWDVLERFGLALHQCEHAGSQIRLLLASIRESLEADAVLWHQAASSEGADLVGAEEELPPAWCEAFTQHVLPSVGILENERLVHFLDPAERPISPWPYSAALMRISKSRGSWLLALSFHPHRLFAVGDLRVMRLARRMVLNHRQQAQTFERLRESLFGLVRCLTASIDAKDPYTWGHSERVARIAVRLGKQMNLPATLLSDLYLGGLLHDIGKIGIRDSVLQKPGKLDPEELAHIQEHPVIGDRLLNNIKSLQHLRPSIRNHHERFDGKGYPDHLAGEEIPLVARIMAVADSCDAMMATRPYRSALPIERIDAIMTEGAGSQWDPRIIEFFLACRHELYSICQRGLGDSVFAAVERALRVRPPSDELSLYRPSAATGKK